MAGAGSRHRSLEPALTAVVGALAVVSLLYVLRFGARSALEYYGLTALLIGGGAALGVLYAKRQRMTRPALALVTLAGAGLACLLTVALSLLGLLFVGDG